MIQQCGIGLVELTLEERGADRQFTFNLPPTKLEPLHAADVAELELILDCKVNLKAAAGIVNVGAIWIVAHLNDAATVLNLQPDLRGWRSSSAASASRA